LDDLCQSLKVQKRLSAGQVNLCGTADKTDKTLPGLQRRIDVHQTSFVGTAAVITKRTGGGTPIGEYQSRIAPQFQQGPAAGDSAVIDIIRRIHWAALDSAPKSVFCDKPRNKLRG
jgi:hypothetical protein